MRTTTTPHACCPICTDTPRRRGRTSGPSPRPVVCRRCGTEFVPYASGSQIRRLVLRTDAA